MRTDLAPRACTLDAMGTMVRLIPPWQAIDPDLVSEIPPSQVEAAFREEMSYYAAHATDARDRESLAALRSRCAEILSAGLGRTIDVGEMMDAIRFEAFEDALPALVELGERGIGTACVSNWDYELPRVLADLGLAEQLDAIVPSARVGAAKPDPAIFELALERLGARPSQAIHVGDSAVDVEGARAAGMAALLIVREGDDDSSEAPTISSLLQIGEHLRR